MTPPEYILECDHSATADRGLTAGDSGFFANYGWGYPGTIRTTQHGKNWHSLPMNGKDFSGSRVAYLNGTLVILTGNNWTNSTDHGLTWQVQINGAAPMGLIGAKSLRQISKVGIRLRF